MKEADKARAISELSKQAAVPYSKILTRYPLADRAEDAKKRLSALHEPVPRPTKAAVAQNKAEIESRGEKTMLGSMKGLIKKGPDVSQAATVGEPPLVDPEPISATAVSKKEAQTFLQAANPGSSKEVGAEIISPNQPANVPPPVDPNPNPNPFGAPAAGATPPAANATANANDPNELKPNQPADPNELTPTSTGADASLPPPTQVNEIQNQSSSSSTAKVDDSTPASDEDISSSKKKKKKGIQKINPF
jgi:outer membrane protein assembly factor BamD